MCALHMVRIVHIVMAEGDFERTTHGDVCDNGIENSRSQVKSNNRIRTLPMTEINDTIDTNAIGD